jgi:hypothetical protein
MSSIKSINEKVPLVGYDHEEQLHSITEERLGIK